MTSRRLNRLFYREIAGPCLITLIVLTFVVFTREFGRLAEMLIRQDAGSVTLLQIVMSILPSVLVFSIPFSFLIGTLIAFSRLSADSEIVAMRAGGVSATQMVWPVLKLGLGVTLLTGLFTFSLLPEGNWKLRLLSHELGMQPIQSAIKPRIFNEDIPKAILYVEDIDLRDSTWKGVFLHTEQPDGEKRTILASKGEMVFSEDGRRLQLHLENGSIYATRETAPERDSLTRFTTQDVVLQMPQTEPAFSKPKRPKDRDIFELWRYIQREDAPEQRANLVEFHTRLALPLACLLFAVIAVTLGNATPRGGRGHGFLVSVTIAFTYFILFDTGRTLAAGGQLPVWLGGWGADILLAAFAAVSFYAALKDRLFLRRILDNPVLYGSIDFLGTRLRRLVGVFRSATASAGRRFWDFCTLCVQLTRVIDLYMLRTFVFYLLPTLGICMALFYLFTFFELMDDIYKNKIAYRVLLNYFFFLVPQILILLVPISVLIATLVTFGVMDKTNQVAAFKSCGISVYRIAVPVVLTAVGLGAGLFILQDYVAPYANQKQDYLRNVIKGRPVQTFYQLGRNWIFGEGARLYNYSHFDSENDIFAELSIYEFDISHNKLTRHIYANKARWDPGTRNWILSQGWSRDFDSAGDGYSTFAEKYFPFPERPGYFEQEVKESSKMTYGELNDYIRSLQRSGFEVDQLKTELHKKISFPVVSLIMSILGIPFAFSMGRKGALYGVAVGVIIGIFYWGMFGAFGVMGANGLLAPVLAAWGPNLLFSAAGLLMLTTVRT